MERGRNWDSFLHMRKVCQLSHSGWAGGMAGKIWKLGHAEKNNWDMGTLSRMIAGHKEKRGKGQKNHGILSLGITWRTG